MKVLCLHGTGLNADIMERQLRPIVSGLDPVYEFVYVNGEVERPPVPGLPSQIPGPFFSYFEEMRTEGVRDACELVDIIVQEEGPFEGFIGFSQGASVGVSYMLDRAINQPDEKCPFRWALLFSSIIAVSPDPDYLSFEVALYDAKVKQDNESKGYDREDERNQSTDRFGGDGVPENRAALLTSQSARVAFRDEYFSLLKACAVFAEKQGTESGVRDLEAMSSDMNASDYTALKFPRLYHPLLTHQRLTIPTVHCIGSNDHPEGMTQSALVRKLCTEDNMWYVEHPGGHEIPMDKTTTRAVVAAVKKAIVSSAWT